MDDTSFLLIIVVCAVVGALWWALLIFGVVKGAQYFRRQFEQQLESLEMLHQRWDQMNPQEQAARRAQLGGAFQQLSQLSARVDNITRQRHDLRVGQLMGLAGRAGINWHP
jgi:hypothetical protein